jgi:hypothetical protein
VTDPSESSSANHAPHVGAQTHERLQRAAVIAVCITPVAVGLTATTKTPADLDTLDSERATEQLPSVPSGRGVGWSASQATLAMPSRHKRDAEALVVRELPKRRNAMTRVFENRDGSLRIEEYLTPIYYRTSKGWVPIENRIVADPERRGWLKTEGNAWAASFGPTTDGVMLMAPEGRLTMKPVGSSARPELVSSPKPMSAKSAKDALKESPIPRPGIVRYADVWPDVDVQYEVRGDGLKEDIIVGAPNARASYPFDVDGVRFVLGDDGGLRIPGDLGGRFRVPPPTVLAANGADLTKALHARYELSEGSGGSQRVNLVVDEKSLTKQPRAAFPLTIDPTLSSVAVTNAITINSLNATSTTTPVRVGNEGTTNRRAAVHFSQYESYLNQGYRVYFASVGFTKQPPSYSTQITTSLYDQGGQPTAYADIGAEPSTAIGSFKDPPDAGQLYWPYIEPAKQVDQWFAQNLEDRWFGIRGAPESGTNNMRYYDAFLTMDMFKPPDPSRVVNLTERQELTTTTPTLTAMGIKPSTESASGDPMYNFQITTRPEPGTGLVISSGAIQQNVAAGAPPPSWQVPAGALQEGRTYYAWVLTDWYNNLSLYSKEGRGAPETVPPSSWGVPFSVDLGLGEGGAAPTDEVGAVPGEASTPSEGAPNPGLPPAKITANLVDGNTSIAVGTPTFQTVSGGLSFGFRFNSLSAALQSNRGLRGLYYNDANGNRVIEPASDPLVGERVDPTVAFDIGARQKLTTAQDPGRALAEWNGFVTLPSSGTWQMGAISSDGIKITSGGSTWLDDWTAHAPTKAPKFGSSFTASGAMPIKIQWQHSSANRAVVRVFAKYVSGSGQPIYPLSPDWLTSSPKILPAGWNDERRVLNGALGAACRQR